MKCDLGVMWGGGGCDVGVMWGDVGGCVRCEVGGDVWGVVC